MALTLIFNIFAYSIRIGFTNRTHKTAFTPESVFFSEVMSQELRMFVPQDMNGFLFQPSENGSKRYIRRIRNQKMNVILIRFHDIDTEFGAGVSLEREEPFL